MDEPQKHLVSERSQPQKATVFTGSPEKWNQCDMYMYKKIYFKVLAHMIMEVGKSKIYRVE